MAEKSKRWVAVLRTLHQSRKLNCVSEGAELLYRRLLEVCDDNGNYDADPVVLLGQVFTRRMKQGLTTDDTLARRTELIDIGLIQLYANDELLHICNHYSRLRKDTLPDIRYEEPTRNEPVTEPSQSRNDCVTLDRTVPNRTEPYRTVPSIGRHDSDDPPQESADIKAQRDREVQVRNWFAGCYKRIHGNYPTGYDPEDRRMSVQERRACAFLLDCHAKERKDKPGYISAAELETRLLNALVGNYYKLRPPANLAEFRKVLNNCVETALRPIGQRNPIPTVNKP